jgi:hypothetical protein
MELPLKRTDPFSASYRIYLHLATLSAQNEKFAAK